MTFSQTETTELLKAWFAITLAFTIAGVGVGSPAFVNQFVIAGVTVGISFLIHEMAHKFLAQQYGCYAEFRAFDLGLVLAVLMSFTGFIFAAPGAVMIAGVVTDEENGRISAAGPLTNIILALGFWLLGGLGIFTRLGDNGLLAQLSLAGFQINAWLAFFNLIPFWQLDGLKIMNWNSKVWAGLIITAGILTFVL